MWKSQCSFNWIKLPVFLYLQPLLTGNFLDSLTNKIRCNKGTWHPKGPPALPGGDTPGPAASGDEIAGNWQEPSRKYCPQLPSFMHCWDETHTWNFSYSSDPIQQAPPELTVEMPEGEQSHFPGLSFPWPRKIKICPFGTFARGERAIQLFLNKLTLAVKEQSCRCHLMPCSHGAGGHRARVQASAIGDISSTTLGTVAK